MRRRRDRLVIHGGERTRWPHRTKEDGSKRCSAATARSVIVVRVVIILVIVTAPIVAIGTLANKGLGRAGRFLDSRSRLLHTEERVGRFGRWQGRCWSCWGLSCRGRWRILGHHPVERIAALRRFGRWAGDSGSGWWWWRRRSSGCWLQLLASNRGSRCLRSNLLRAVIVVR